MKIKLLLNRYHPVVDDLAQSLALHFNFSVDVAINPTIIDHFGSHSKILEENKKNIKNVSYISLQESLIKIKSKKYDLIGVDGVFEGDKIIISLCKSLKTPYFCISGYPYLADEDATNILSFSWFMPQIQFVQRFQSEYDAKTRAWDPQLKQKNIEVFYPEFLYLKNQKFEKFEKKYWMSSINRFEECNPIQYSIFKNVEAKFQKIENFTSLSNKELIEKLKFSKGLIHIKGMDCPGIVLIESMLVGVVPFVFRQFILSSFNQDLLIDNYSCVVSDSVEEFVDNLKSNKWEELSESTRQHAMIMTDFNRQKSKLYKFFERCINGKY